MKIILSDKVKHEIRVTSRKELESIAAKTPSLRESIQAELERREELKARYALNNMNHS